MHYKWVLILLFAQIALAQEPPVMAPRQVLAQIQFPVTVHFSEDVPAGATANLLLLGDREWTLSGSLSAPVSGRTATFPQVSLLGQRGSQGSVRLVAVVLDGSRTLSVSSEPIAVGPAPLPSVTLQDRPFGGIGVDLSEQDGGLVVKEVLEGLPADKAGLHEQDRLLRIDGKDVSTATLEQCTPLLRGPVGSSVRLAVRHRNQEVEEYTLLRGQLHDSPVAFDYVPSQRDRVPFQISLLVRDDGGNPLPGARVMVRMDPEYQDANFLFISTRTRMGDASGLLSESLSAVTDENGRATLWVRLVNNTTPFDFRFSGVAEWGQAASRAVHSNVFTVYDNQ